MMMEKNFVSGTCVLKYFEFISKNEELVYLSYLPLAHIWERLNLAAMLVARGRYAVFNGDINK